MKTLVLIGLVVFTGCSMGISVGEDRLVKLGNPATTQAEYDGLNGVINNTKQSADTVSAWYMFRGGQETEITNRQAGKKSLLGSWFSNSEAK